MVDSLTVPDVAQHVNPLPNAATHGGILCTSAILGKNPDADDYPLDIEKQTELCFFYLTQILEAASATLQDVVKVDLFFHDKLDRNVVNQKWKECWPEPAHRPARQSHVSILPQGCRLQISAIAVLPQQSD